MVVMGPNTYQLNLFSTYISNTVTHMFQYCVFLLPAVVKLFIFIRNPKFLMTIFICVHSTD